jgi:hypothetical protein
VGEVGLRILGSSHDNKELRTCTKSGLPRCAVNAPKWAAVVSPGFECRPVGALTTGPRPAGGRAYAYAWKVNPGYSSTSRKNQQLTCMIQVMALNTVRRHCGFHLPPVNTLMSPISSPIHTMMAT